MFEMNLFSYSHLNRSVHLVHSIMKELKVARVPKKFKNTSYSSMYCYQTSAPDGLFYRSYSNVPNQGTKNDCLNLKNKTTPSNSSSLYVPSYKRSVVCSILEPYLDFDRHFENIGLLADELEERGLADKFSKQKLISLKESWINFKDASSKRENIERQTKTLQNKMKALSPGGKLHTENSAAEKSKLKKEVIELRRSIKEFSIVEYEDTLIPDLLDIPNRLDPNTPRYEDEILSTYLKQPTFNFDPMCHLDIGKKNKNIELSNVSPGAFYLLGDLAEVELALEDYFVEIFNGENFIHHSNPDLSKGVSTEGCGHNIHDPSEVLKILYQKESKDTTSLFLTGGCSLSSFTAYFAKRIVGKPQKFLPQKLFATGRLYRPLQTSDGNSASIFNSMQSSAVSSFIAYSKSDSGSDNIKEEVLDLINKAYKGLGLHFRIVNVSAKNLEKNESCAYSIEMFTTTANIDSLSETSDLNNNYIEVGRISLLGNYISKRLLMLHTSSIQVNATTYNPSLDFLEIIYIKVMDISKFIAVMVENTQTEDCKYKVPATVQEYLLR